MLISYQKTDYVLCFTKIEGTHILFKKQRGTNMDFLDYVKMCQEETKSVNESNKQLEVHQLEERRPSCRGQIYKVKQGDTLYSISRKYNLRVRDLMRANPFVNVYQLQIGEELCIPVMPAPDPIPGIRPYVVKREDTVLSILNDQKLTFQELAKLNRSAQVLKFPPGTVLLVPTK